MKYSVSVIIIAYNTEKYIKECLDSVFSQNFEDFEVVIVDNASTDDTANIIASRIKGRDNVNFIRNAENLGGAVAGNLGIKNAQGEYAFLMDSDDVMPEGTLSALSGCAKKYNSDVVIGRAKSIYGDQIRNLKFKFYCIPYALPGVYNRDNPCRELLISPFYWGKLYRTAFLRENDVYMPEKKLYADLYFSTKAVKCAETVAVCDHLSYLWRRFEDADAHISITNSANQTENFSDRIQSYYELEELFDDEEELQCIRVYNLVRLLIPVKSVCKDPAFAQFYFEKMREYLGNVSLRDVAASPYLTAKKKVLCYLIKENRFEEFVKLSNPEYELDTYNEDKYAVVRNENRPENVPNDFLRHVLQKPHRCSLENVTKSSGSYRFHCSVNTSAANDFTYLRAVLVGRNGYEKYVAEIESQSGQSDPAKFSFVIPRKAMRGFPISEKYRIAVELLFNGNFCSVWLYCGGKTLAVSDTPFGICSNGKFL